MDLNNTLDWMELTDIFRTFHSKTAEYKLFSSAHGTFFRINHILGHKSGLNKYKMIEIIRCVFSEHNIMKSEVNHRKKKIGKTTKRWRLENILKDNEWIN